MKVLVIGGTGNISSAIVSLLLAKGHEVTCFNRGRRPVRYDGHVDVINGDRHDLPAFEAAVKHLKVDAVIDMLAFNPADAEATIRAFGGRGIHIIFTSSVAAYKRPLMCGVPIPDDAPLWSEPNDYPYGYHKGQMEIYLRGLMALGEPITIIRPSLTYGIGCSNIGILRQNAGIVKRIREGKPLVMFGDGAGSWTFTFSPDLAKAYVGAIGNPATFRKFYHACSHEQHIWDDLYLAFGRAVGVEPKIIHMSTDMLMEAAPEVFSHIVWEKRFSGLYDTTAIRRDVPSFTIDYTLDKIAKTVVDWWDGGKDPVAEGERGWALKPELDALEDKLVALNEKWGAEARALRG